MIFDNIQFNIRIKQIEFKDFRNIESGTVYFPNASTKDYYDVNPSILGLYGQNGSGKSSVIMALGILKEVLSGRKISDKYLSCIRDGCDNCSLKFIFSAFEKHNNENIEDIPIENSQCIEIFYDFDIIKNKVKIIDDFGTPVESITLAIENEVIKTRETDYSGRIITPKRVLFDTRKSASEDKDMVFGCNIFTYVELTNGDEKEIVEQYKKTKIISRENGCSFLFSNQFFEISLKKYADILNDKRFKEFSNIMLRFCLKCIKNSNRTEVSKKIASLESAKSYNEFDHIMSSITDSFEIDSLEKNLSDNYTDIELEDFYPAFFRSQFFTPMLCLQYYAYYYLQVIDTVTTGITNVNTRLPLLLWKRNNLENDDIFFYKCSLMMDKPSVVPEQYYPDTIKALKAVSNVLNTIVPEIELDFTDLGKCLGRDNKEEHCFEILSKRNNTTIPLKFESDGIRRMVSILSLLIAVYNEESFTVAIDEIDSGIFEYLLGEILSVMSESIKGQFIFTSHNLRPLEVLPAKYLCFTTTNPENRFTTLPHRGNSNMRDTYFRNIILGSNKDKEPIYKATDKFEIERAFYKAGHPEDGEL